LAASVALMLGACWYLSNGFAPGMRSQQPTAAPSAPGMLQGSGADGAHDPRLKKIEEEKTNGNTGGAKIDMGKIE
jgi:hypothetical protein